MTCGMALVLAWGSRIMSKAKGSRLYHFPTISKPIASYCYKQLLFYLLGPITTYGFNTEGFTISLGQYGLY